MFGIPKETMDKFKNDAYIQSEMNQLPEKIRKDLTNAAASNDLTTVKFFVEVQSVPLTQRINNPGEKLVHIAARHGSLDVVKYLLEKDPSLLAETDNHGFNVLHIAIEEGLPDLVEYLVEKCNADIDEANQRDFRCSAIHSAIEFGHLNIVKYLIEKRHVDVNTLTYDTHGEPPLFLAVRYRHGDIIEYLLNERKANVTILSMRQENVLYVAVRKNDLPFMKYLLDEKKEKFDINWRNDGSETLALVAAKLNRLNVLKYLVEEKHADINIPDVWTNLTCLHYAASRNHFEVCKYLIEHGANAQVRDKDGHSPAEKASDEHLIQYLRTQSTRNRRSAPTNRDTASRLADSAFRSISVGSLHEFGKAGYLSTHAISRGRRETEICSRGYFQSFLLMLTSVVRTTNHSRLRVENLDFRASQPELDPIALDVVNGASPI